MAADPLVALLILARRRRRHVHRHGRDAGVSIILGAVLLFGMVTSWLAVASVTYLPQLDKGREAEHMQAVERELSDLVSTLTKQADNRTTAPASTPVSLGVSHVDILHKNHAAHLLDLRAAGSDVRFEAPHVILRDLNGTTYRELNETFVDIATDDTLENVDTVETFRLRISEISKEHVNENITVTIRDADGDFAGDLTVSVLEETPHFLVRIQTRDASGTEVYRQDWSYFQQTDFSPYWIDLLLDEHRFRPVLEAASAPRSIGLTQNGLTGSYSIAYRVHGSGGTVVFGGGGGLHQDPWYANFTGGRVTYQADNTNYVDQTLVAEHGSLLLQQEDGALFKVRPPWKASQAPNVVTLGLTLPVIEGEATTVVGQGTFTLYTDTGRRYTTLANMPRLTINMTTVAPSLWDAQFDRILASTNLTEGTGYTVTTGSNWVRLHIEGPISDPNDDTRDVNVALQQAQLAVRVNEIATP